MLLCRENISLGPGWEAAENSLPCRCLTSCSAHVARFPTIDFPPASTCELSTCMYVESLLLSLISGKELVTGEMAFYTAKILGFHSARNCFYDGFLAAQFSVIPSCMLVVFGRHKFKPKALTGFLHEACPNFCTKYLGNHKVLLRGISQKTWFPGHVPGICIHVKLLQEDGKDRSPCCKISRAGSVSSAWNTCMTKLRTALANLTSPPCFELSGPSAHIPLTYPNQWLPSEQKRREQIRYEQIGGEGRGCSRKYLERRPGSCSQYQMPVLW